MKKDKTKTTGYNLFYTLVCIALFMLVLMYCKSVFERWSSDNDIDNIQYNEVIDYHQKEDKVVCSDGYSIRIKTNKVLTK